MNIKAFHHICIQTECYVESLKFYTELLGFKLLKDNRDFHTRDHNSWLEAANCKIELQTTKKDTKFLPWSQYNSGPVHLALVVDDVTECYNRIKASGHKKFKVKPDGRELYPINENTTIFKVIAPEGTEIEICDKIGID